MSTAEFKEICPAGPGYHYSPVTLKLNQRLAEPQSPALVPQTNRTATTVTRYNASSLQSTARSEPGPNQRPTRPQSATISHNVRIQQSRISQPITSDVFIIQSEPQPSQHKQPGGPASATSQPSRELPCEYQWHELNWIKPDQLEIKTSLLHTQFSFQRKTNELIRLIYVCVRKT